QQRRDRRHDTTDARPRGRRWSQRDICAQRPRDTPQRNHIGESSARTPPSPDARAARSPIIHPSDGSLHTVFSPPATAGVVNARWGQRHSLASLARLPLTDLMIYAPRNADELVVVRRLLDAAVSHMAQSPKP